MALLQSRFEMNPLVSSAIKIAALSGPQKHHLRSLGPEAPEATDFEAQLSPLTNDLNPYRRIRGEHRAQRIGDGGGQTKTQAKLPPEMQAFLKRAWNAGT
jgi:hypothetical protein